MPILVHPLFCNFYIQVLLIKIIKKSLNFVKIKSKIFFGLIVVFLSSELYVTLGYQMLNSTIPPTLTPALTPTPSILKPTLAPTLAPVPVLPAATPQYSLPPVSSPPVMTKPQAATRPVKLVSADLDESLSTLAGNINIDPLAHVRKYGTHLLHFPLKKFFHHNHLNLH